MSQNGVVAHAQQSLPSFAQAFSPSSLDQISQGSRISLPPIQTQDRSRLTSPANASYSRQSSTEPSNPRKRGRESHENDSDSNTNSPPISRVKEEPKQDNLDPPPPHSQNSHGLQDTSGAPTPSSVHPLKRRRVTVSGPPHPGALNTDVRSSGDQGTSTPISPVVVGFTIQRDNPNAVEQVRSMITVKQQQKALIEQRRGSVAGLVSPPNVPPITSTSALAPAPSATPAGPPNVRPVRRSPNAGATGGRRLTTSNIRPPSPPPPSQPGPSNLVANVNPHSLPPPPISFARRRATQAGGKKKPADIMISPREAHTKEQLALAIQSAPPIPRADGQQGSFYSGRMALPRLPSVLSSGENVKRVTTGNVPPTPTRLALLRNASAAGPPGVVGRSPPTATVAIASTLVPPTPSSLHHPGYSGDKSAFLAPFEMFYDALNDSKQLKSWLGDQLSKSQSLMQSLQQQQDQLHGIVENMVERKVGAMKAEMSGMHRRIEQLEDALRTANGAGGRHPNTDLAGSYKGKERQTTTRNGPMPPDSYSFPPVERERLMAAAEADRRISSPSMWHGHLDRGDGPSGHDSDNGSPALYPSRRLSVSATRLEAPVRGDGRSMGPGSSPSQFRESREGSYTPVNKSMGRRPTLNRQQSSPRMPGILPAQRPPPGLLMRRPDEEQHRRSKD